MAAEFYAGAGGKGPEAAATLGDPLEFDFEAEPEAPVWRVEQVYEQGTVNLFSGDTGAAKSIMAGALAVAAATGGDWLGRRVAPTYVLYVDEENPDRLVRRRLKALGMTNAARGALRYLNRQGVALDGEGSLEALRRDVERYDIGLVIIDTTTSATNADLLDNRAVADVFKALRATLGDLMAARGLTVVILHHERKRRQNEAYNASRAPAPGPTKPMRTRPRPSRTRSPKTRSMMSPPAISACGRRSSGAGMSRAAGVS